MEKKRILVFLFGCILTRTLITILSKHAKGKYLKVMGYIALFIGICFMYLYFIGNDKADAQLEWLGDKHIWWNELRPIYGALYLLFALYAIQEKNYAWIFLLIDILVGLISWLIYHKIIF